MSTAEEVSGIRGSSIDYFSNRIFCSESHSFHIFSTIQYKAKGNAALQAKNYSEAIENYTKAINLEGSNVIYYSNRSAAYLSAGDAQNALEDAKACLGLDPNFSKGYSRKGAALHALKLYNDSIAAYQAGLERFPGDSALTSGLESVKKEKERMNSPGFGGGGGGGNGLGGLFGPEMMARIALDPKLRGYLNDPTFMTKLQTLQKDPNQLSTMLSDPRIMEVLQSMLNLNFDRDEDDSGFGASTRPPTTHPSAASSSSFTTKTESQKKPEPATVHDVQDDDDEDEEMVEEVNPAEMEKKEKVKAAVKAKDKGNDLYGKKMFDEAIAAYDEAIQLDPTNMTFLSNKAAVYFTTKKYDECIAACMEAVEVGKANRASFEDRAKALTRCAKAYQSKGDLAMAIEMCKRSQLESYNKDTERLLKNMELDKRKADALAYQDDEKAEEAKQQGNNYFRNKEWAKAVEAYEEAVKRAPKNASIRNNLAAALSKIMDFNGAKREIELAVELDPKYVKAWARKGDIEILTKEYHKALESFRKGLEIEPDNASCKEGLQKVTALINYGSANMSEAERKERAAHAMADPEIQAILQDPIIIQVLRDFQENPRAANEAMRDTVVRSKIEKLVASGIVQMA